MVIWFFLSPRALLTSKISNSNSNKRKEIFYLRSKNSNSGTIKDPNNTIGSKLSWGKIHGVTLSQLSTNPDYVPNHTLQQGIIRCKNRVVIGTDNTLRTKLLSTLHNSELGGHSGERATYHRVKLVFHWQGMKQDVIAFVKACPVCQLNKAEHSP